MNKWLRKAMTCALALSMACGLTMAANAEEGGKIVRVAAVDPQVALDLHQYTYRLFDLIHIFCSSAAAISSSRKSGWAIEISISARSQVVRPTRFTTPNSVATK